MIAKAAPSPASLCLRSFVLLAFLAVIIVPGCSVATIPSGFELSGAVVLNLAGLLSIWWFLRCPSRPLAFKLLSLLLCSAVLWLAAHYTAVALAIPMF